MTRATITTAAGLLAVAAMAGPAQAAVNPSAVDVLSGFPLSYVDDGGTPDDNTDDLALQLCQDESGNCIETPRPHPADPIAVPDNFTEDAEGFYFLADATVPNAGAKSLLRIGKEAAFVNGDIQAGDQDTFTRFRFRFQQLKVDHWYRVTHPYGVDEFKATLDPDPKANGAGLINQTIDLPAAAAGVFGTDPDDRMTSFLRWDSGAPAGYIGAYNTPHTVTGSPLGTNFVQLDEIDGPGGVVVATVGRTDKFNVQGKVLGTPPGPTANITMSAKALSFSSQQVGTPSDPQTVTITNRGTAPLSITGMTISGTGAASYAKSTTCGASLDIGASCSVEVTFTPTQAGTRNAVLQIDDNAIGAPHTVSLTGTGAAATVATTPDPQPQQPQQQPQQPLGGTTTIVQIVQPAPQVQVQGVTADSPLAVSRLALARRISVTRLRAHGLRASMRVPDGTNVVRIAIYKTRHGVRTGRALFVTTRTPRSAGLFRVTLRSSAFARLKPGSYVMEVRAGRSAATLGAIRRIAFITTR